MLDSHPQPMALGASSPCDRTANHQHALLLLDPNDPRVACLQSRFQVHQPDEETEVVATMTNTADLTDPQSKGFPAKDPRAIETVQEHQRGIREIRMGPSEVIGRIARGLGGLLLMPVILVRSFAAPLAVTRYHHSRCLALKPRQTMLAHHTSGNHFLRNRCLALMGQGKSLAPHLSASLYLHSRCPRPTTRPTTAIEAWVHLPRSRRTPKGSHK
jgi:hypothetical protein